MSTYLLVLAIFLIVGAVVLGVLTYFSYNRSSNNAEKIGLMVGSGVSLLLSVILLFFWFRSDRSQTNKGIIRKPVDDTTDDDTELTEFSSYKPEIPKDPEELIGTDAQKYYENLSLSNAFKHINFWRTYENYIKRKRPEIKLNDVDINDYYLKIMSGGDVNQLDKKKAALDFFRITEYFGENSNPSENGKRLYREKKTGINSDYTDNVKKLINNNVIKPPTGVEPGNISPSLYLSRYLGTGFTRLNKNSETIDSNEYPADIRDYAVVKHGQQGGDPLEIISAAVNQTLKEQSRGSTLMDDFVEEKRESQNRISNTSNMTY
jgi:hypothetical protein